MFLRECLLCNKRDVDEQEKKAYDSFCARVAYKTLLVRLVKRYNSVAGGSLRAKLNCANKTISLRNKNGQRRGALIGGSEKLSGGATVEKKKLPSQCHLKRQTATLLQRSARQLLFFFF